MVERRYTCSEKRGRERCLGQGQTWRTEGTRLEDTGRYFCFILSNRHANTPQHRHEVGLLSVVSHPFLRLFFCLALDTSPCLCQANAHGPAPSSSLPTPSSSSSHSPRLLWTALRFFSLWLHRLHRSLTRRLILLRSALVPQLPRTLSCTPTNPSQSRVRPPRPLRSIPIISVFSLLLTPLFLSPPPFYSPRPPPINL